MNPLFNALGAGQMPGAMGQIQNMVRQFQQFKQSFQGDGALFKDVHSLSLDYIKGAPMLFSCVSDVGETREQWQNSKFMS